jgi:hypothetical protein
MFFISDIWNLSTTPAAAKCGDIDAVAGTDAQGSILILDSVTEANYATLPCKLIGAFRMQYATATHKWTVQALSNNDGIGEQALNATFTTEYVLPVGQMGAEAGKHFTTDDGATALTFSPVDQVSYIIYRNGEVSCNHYYADQSSNGADGVIVRWSLPYVHTTLTGLVSNYRHGSGTALINNVDSIVTTMTFVTTSYGSAYYSNASASNSVTDNVFANALDYIRMSFNLKI